MEYTILTSLHTFDPNRDENDMKYAERLVEEQDAKLNELGYVNDGSQSYLMKFGRHYRIDTIYDAIQSLALKNGADLVQFSNGNVGYIGYYNNVTFDKNNYFEIICKADDKSLLEKYGNEFDYQDSKELFDDRLWSFEWTTDNYADDLVDYLNEKGE